MSLSFEFPGWHVGSSEEVAGVSKSKEPSAGLDWEQDLDELSGDVEDDEGGALGSEDEAHAEPPPEGGMSSSYDGNRKRAGQAESCREHLMDPNVLLLVLQQLSLQEVAAAVAVCTRWRHVVLTSEGIWQRLYDELLGFGWHAEPFKGAKLVPLQPQLAAGWRLQLKATLATTSVALRFQCLRKGYEFLLEAFAALADAVTAAAAAARERQAGPPRPSRRLTHVDQLWDPSTSSSGSSGIQVEERFSARGIQRMVQKLSNNNWQLLYEGYTAALVARADVLAQQLLQQHQQRLRGAVTPVQAQGQQEQEEQERATASLKEAEQPRLKPQQQQQEQQGEGAVAEWQRGSPAGGAAAEERDKHQEELQQRGDMQQEPHLAATAAAAGPTAATAGATAASGPSTPLLDMYPTSSQGPVRGADTADLRDSPPPEDGPGPGRAPGRTPLGPAGLPTSTMGVVASLGSRRGSLGGAAGLVTAQLLSHEPEMPLAAAGLASRAPAGIQLWVEVVQVWADYHRWLDLLVARCGLLGARVAAARQLLGPGCSKRSAAAIPHLLNKGLLVFRSQVLLAAGLRRPLQEAALWLSASAAVDGEAWRSGLGLSESDLGLSESYLGVLVAVRKLLTELDVWDDASQPALMHTHEKFRSCFGALILRDGRVDKFGLRER